MSWCLFKLSQTVFSNDVLGNPIGAVIQDDDGEQWEVIDEACAVWTLTFASFFFIALEFKVHRRNLLICKRLERRLQLSRHTGVS